jgi:hypothetical protein
MGVLNEKRCKRKYRIKKNNDKTKYRNTSKIDKINIIK